MKDLDICSEIRKKGFYSPVHLFTRKECEELIKNLENTPKPYNWEKGYAVNSKAFYEIANNEKIVDIVSSVIGQDILLWGASTITRKPGQEHPWHCDIETSASPPGKTLSVWIGLSNTRKSSLKLISHSHKFSKIFQQTAYEHGKSRGQSTDADVIEWARNEKNESRLVFTDIINGQAIFFDGKLWHSSFNRNILGTRKAVLLQFAATDTEIRKFNRKKLDWPFDYKSEQKAPCLLIRGKDNFKTNSIIETQF